MLWYSGWRTSIREQTDLVGPCFTKRGLSAATKSEFQISDSRFQSWLKRIDVVLLPLTRPSGRNPLSLWA